MVTMTKKVSLNPPRGKKRRREKWRERGGGEVFAMMFA